jgi:hypothetical protein
MMRSAVVLLFLTALSGLPPEEAARGNQEQETAPDSLALLQQARRAAADMLQSTKQVLLRHLGSGGPVRAIAACADSAPLIARTVSERQGVAIRRVSERWRNPAHIPDPYEKEVLRAFASLRSQGTLTEATEHFAILRDEARPVARYSRSIIVQGMCLSCHGPDSSLSPGLRDLLRQRYPDDHAIGYATGDLRGAVSVTIPLSGRPQ